MRNLIIAALAATALLPTAAMARPDQTRPGQVRVTTVDHRGPHVTKTTTVWRGPAAHNRLVVGTRLTPAAYSRDRAIARPGRYDLARAGANHRWVRVADDAVLVNLRSGRVVTVVNRVFR